MTILEKPAVAILLLILLLALAKVFFQNTGFIIVASVAAIAMMITSRKHRTI